MSCELRVASCELRVASWIFILRVDILNHELIILIYELRVASCELQKLRYELNLFHELHF